MQDVAQLLINHFEGKSREEIEKGTGDDFVQTCIQLTGKRPSVIGGQLVWIGIWRRFNRHFGLTDTGLY